MPIGGSSPTKTFSRAIGAYTGADAWAQLDAAGVAIRSADQDTRDEDFAGAINQCLFKDGSNLNADIPMNTNKFTGVENAAARDQFAAAGQVQDGALLWLGTSSGTNTVTASATFSPGAYAAGQRFAFKAGGTNTGATTLNVSSLGAKDVRKGAAGATALDAGDITTGGVYSVIYDGTLFVLENPGTQNITPQPLDELLTEIAALSTDPNADSGLFFDDSAGNIDYWTPTGALSFSGTNLTVASASDSAVGVQENAVQSEMEAGSSTTLTVTPGRQQFHPSAAKLWARVTGGGTPVLTANYNVTSVTDVDVGRLTVTVATDFSANNFSYQVSSLHATTTHLNNSIEAASVGSATFRALEEGGAGFTDPTEWHIVAHGDQ